MSVRGEKERAGGRKSGGLEVTPDLVLDERELAERFIRASGPGGQNVNKVATAVQLQFDVRRSPSLPEPVRERLLRLAGRRVSSDGILTIVARRFRTQEEDRLDARRRLVALVARAGSPPPPRRPTQPTPGSEARRLADKRRRSETKSSRRFPAGSGLVS